MELKTVIGKLLKSEPLNALEKAELENFDFTRVSGEAMDKLQRERDSLFQELETLRKRNRMEKLCAQLHCTDPDYLEFCARRSNVDTGDDEAMRRFAGELAAVSPGCFTAHIVPGSSAGSFPDSPPGACGRETSPCDRIGSIAVSISEAPEAH